VYVCVCMCVRVCFTFFSMSDVRDQRFDTGGGTAPPVPLPFPPVFASDQIDFEVRVRTGGGLNTRGE